MTVDLSDYQEVPARIAAFFEKYPDGSLRCEKVEYLELPAAHLGGKPCVHIIYHALAYRTAEDKRPGQGKASEPLPGLTPYTKGSELMNAETSAWGRALVALGFVSKKIASAEEVRNRQDAPRNPSAPKSSTRPGKASEPQQKLVKKLVTEKRATPAQLRVMLDAIGAVDVGIAAGWTAELTGGKEGQASDLISWLMERPLPDVEHPSDLDGSGFEEPSEADLEAARLEFEAS